MASRAKTPGSGRKVGSLNKATLERLEQASSAVVESRRTGKKLPKETLLDFMTLFAGMAATVQPWPDSQGRNPKEDPAMFFRCAELAVDTAHKAAPFFHPTFKGIAVFAAPGGDEIPAKPATADNVIQIDDAEALARVYKRRIAGVG